MSNEQLVTRNLTVLFGFFFIIFSTLVAAATSLSVQIPPPPPTTLMVLFVTGVQLSIGCTLIGIEIWMRYSKEGLGPGGKLGLSWLVLITPLLYNVLLAYIMGLDFLVLVLGILAQVVGIQSPYLYSFFRSNM